jgi:thiol:disulfide interchange protein DsbD
MGSLVQRAEGFVDIRLSIQPSRGGLRAVVLFLVCVALEGMGVAQERGASIPHGAAELVSERESIQPGHILMLGLHFRLEQGWHIYWINPGDSGEPPRVEWRLPAGLRAGAIEWPAPTRLPIATLVDYGYEGEVLLPVLVETNADLRTGSDATLAADLKAIVCREVCIPAKADLTLSLPVRANRPHGSKEAVAMFRAAKQAMPKPTPADWRPSARDLGDRFELKLTTGHSVSGAWFAPLEPLQIENAAPQKSVSTATGIRLILKKSDQLSKPISRLRGVLVLPRGAYGIDAPVAPRQSKKPNKE